MFFNINVCQWSYISLTRDINSNIAIMFLFFRAIPVAKFPDHFYQLGVDENRGFTQEYEVHTNCVLFFLFRLHIFSYEGKNFIVLISFY